MYKQLFSRFRSERIWNVYCRVKGLVPIASPMKRKFYPRSAFLLLIKGDKVSNPDDSTVS